MIILSLNINAVTINLVSNSGLENNIYAIGLILAIWYYIRSRYRKIFVSLKTSITGKYIQMIINFHNKKGR
jgi:hypothetical protein